MTKEEIKTIETAMLEEHRRDLEALERLKRFVPDAAPKGSGSHKTHSVVEEEGDSGADASLRDKVAEVLSAEPVKCWTAQKVLDRLIELNFPLGSKKPKNGVSVALGVWVKRGKAHIYRKGSGRRPHVYRWGPKAPQNTLFTTK
jgi:hypothetical protein